MAVGLSDMLRSSVNLQVFFFILLLPCFEMPWQAASCATAMTHCSNCTGVTTRCRKGSGRKGDMHHGLHSRQHLWRQQSQPVTERWQQFCRPLHQTMATASMSLRKACTVRERTNGFWWNHQRNHGDCLGDKGIKYTILHVPTQVNAIGTRCSSQIWNKVSQVDHQDSFQLQHAYEHG